MHVKKQFTDGCSHSSVHTLFTHGDTSGSVVHVSGMNYRLHAFKDVDGNLHCS